MSELINTIRLIRSSGVGPRTFYSLIHKFGSLDEALEYVGDKACPREKAEKEIEQVSKLGIKILLHVDPAYPESLRSTYDAPPLLFYKGNISLFSQTSIAVVGTRNSSAAGINITRKICTELGEQGYVIISGLARGIDTEAHKATLKSGTIAVVAGGLDVIYPPENKKLYEQIAAEGLIIGENPAGTEPIARHFPQRNRIIAGAAAGILVVEAARKSGSMITADYGLREGREVFAIPGSPLDPRSGGTNYLIKNGAVLVENAADIIDNLGKGLAPQLLILREEEPILETVSILSPHEWSQSQDGIISILSVTPVSVDEIVQQTGQSVSSINQQLLELEMEGKVRRTIGNKVALVA
jgi:DNA processing protein